MRIFGEKLIIWISSNTFLCSTIIGVLGGVVVRIFSDCSWLLGIGQSIVASYFFYLMLEYLPQKGKEYHNVVVEAILYRKLQLILVRLDDIFIYPHKYKKHDVDKLDNMTVEEFYSEEFQSNTLSMFPYWEADSNVVCLAFDNKNRTMKFSEVAISNWKDINRYAREILINPLINNNPELLYEIDCLIHDNVISIFMNNMSIMKQHIGEDFLYQLYMAGKEGDSHGDLVKTLIKLHYIAYKMYNRLSNYNIGIVHKPMFYPKNLQ